MLVYTTDKVVHIPNKCLALTWWFLVIGIALYIGGYGIIWTKSYQDVAAIESVVVTKVKGVLQTTFTDKELGVTNPEFYRRVWDSYDIVTPAHGGESGGFFILTNVLITPNQTRSLCSENSDIEGAKCTSDAQCKRGRSLNIGNGYMTGKCIPHIPEKKLNIKTCEISAWCPVEPNEKPLGGNRALLLDTQEFTVLVKNSIEFPTFGRKYKRRNVLETSNTTDLQTCLYDSKKNPYCPTFKLWDIVNGAGENYAQVALTGGVFSLQINWNCDFDWGQTIDSCLPKYSFARMDNPNAALSPGFNFRSTVYHEENRRTLTQNFGLKFLIKVEGEGRKFDSIKFVLALGASIGLFALATVICDLMFKLLCVMKNYVKWKWLHFYNEDMKYDWSYVNRSSSSSSDQNVSSVSPTTSNLSGHSSSRNNRNNSSSTDPTNKRYELEPMEV